MAQPSELGGSRPPTRIPATLQRSPTVAPTGVPRQTREGDYIVTYSPTGAIISRVYSPVVRQTQNTNRSESQVVRTSDAARAQNFVNRFKPAQPQQTTKGLFGGAT